MNSFTFNGKSSSDFGLIIEDKEIYSMPARDVSFVSVPGRNGDVLIDNNRYDNVTVSYTVGIKDITSNIKNIKAWLSTPGYFELTDTYNSGYYRLASFSSNLSVTELLSNVGRAVISFNCKPFMYSYTDQLGFMVTKDFTLTNPEVFSSNPLLEVYGSGDVTFYINSNTYTIKNVEDFVDIDSELMIAYRDSVSFNNNISFTEFPTLVPGSNSISLGSNCTKIKVIPRWRTL